MTTVPTPDLITWISQIIGPNGAIFLLLVFITGLMKKWWVLGWQYDDVIQHRNLWESMATRNAQLADKTLDATATRNVPPQV